MTRKKIVKVRPPLASAGEVDPDCRTDGGQRWSIGDTPPFTTLEAARTYDAIGDNGDNFSEPMHLDWCSPTVVLSDPAD